MKFFFAFSTCISLINSENINLHLGKVEQLLIWRHNDSAIFQSPRHERDFQFSRVCYSVTFQDMCLLFTRFECSSRYLHIEKNCISKFGREHFLWDFENGLNRVNLRQRWCQPSYRWSCKISLNTEMFFKFFVF